MGMDSLMSLRFNNVSVTSISLPVDNRTIMSNFSRRTLEIAVLPSYTQISLQPSLAESVARLSLKSEQTTIIFLVLGSILIPSMPGMAGFFSRGSISCCFVNLPSQLASRPFDCGPGRGLALAQDSTPRAYGKVPRACPWSSTSAEVRIEYNWRQSLEHRKHWLRNIHSPAERSNTKFRLRE